MDASRDAIASECEKLWSFVFTYYVTNEEVGWFLLLTCLMVDFMSIKFRGIMLLFLFQEKNKNYKELQE